MASPTEPVVVWLRAGARVHVPALVALDALPDDGPVDLLATGDACADALRIAAASPERVRALVLESPRCAPDPQVTVPTLVAIGTDDPSSDGAAFRAAMPNCQYVLVYAAGADVAGDRPEAFGSLVRDFLARREGFIVTERSGLLHP